MKRIVATEKLQELNLPSESEFFRAAEISKRNGTLNFDLFDPDTCVPISRHSTTFRRHFRDGKICVSRY